MTPPLWGLLLAGGKSSRMGRDKALLSYPGLQPETSPHLVSAMALLQSVCTQVYVSVAKGQAERLPYAELSVIPDGEDSIGPMGGLLSAMRAYPNVAWLVLACDMPRVEAGTLNFLIAQRSATTCATVFQRPKNSRLEPLCAIYEPKCLPLLEQRVGKGKFSLRDFLRSVPVHLLNAPFPDSLININTPESYRQLLECHDSPPDSV